MYLEVNHNVCGYCIGSEVYEVMHDVLTQSSYDVSQSTDHSLEYVEVSTITVSTQDTWPLTEG